MPFQVAFIAAETEGERKGEGEEGETNIKGETAAVNAPRDRGNIAQ